MQNPKMKKELLIPAWSFITIGNVALMLNKWSIGMLFVIIGGAFIFVGTRE